MASTLPQIPGDGIKPASPTQPPRLPSGGVIPNLKDRIPKLEPRRRKAEPVNPMPVPATPPAPPRPDPATLNFTIPTRRILSPQDHQLFLSSPTYNLILSFIFGLSESVVDRPISSVKDTDLSPTVKSILTILDEADALCQDSPPDDQGGSRFGNKTFRVFLDKVKQRSPAWHATLLNPNPPNPIIPNPTAATTELSAYLTQSFGSRRRIDYGSGHELNFAMWLLSLFQLSLLQRADFPALVLRVFTRYLAVMRRVQSTYYLEPAGSHGVWGLDDYQFLPFLWGASQLAHHAVITPRAIHQELLLEEYGGEFLYLGQVAFVNSTKTVRGLRWHSPMLDDISGARGGWGKIEAGMRRMFVSEVLGKLPVMQHFLFGSLVPAVEGMSEPLSALGRGGDEDGEEGEEEEDGEVEVFDDTEGVRHVHQPKGWGDCCGIKVPSSLAAAAEMKKRGVGEQLRRIPFD